MQFQADLLGVPVVRPKVLETTALGAGVPRRPGGRLLDRPRRRRRELAARPQLRAVDAARPRRRADRGLEQGGRASQGLGVAGHHRGRQGPAGPRGRAALEPGVGWAPGPGSGGPCDPRSGGPWASGPSPVPRLECADERPAPRRLAHPHRRPRLRRRHPDAGDGHTPRLRPVPAADERGPRLGPRDLRLRDGPAEPDVGRGAALRRPARRPLRRAPRALASAACSMSLGLVGDGAMPTTPLALALSRRRADRPRRFPASPSRRLRRDRPPYPPEKRSMALGIVGGGRLLRPVRRCCR